MDNLMERVRGKNTPAIGFALGVDRVVDIIDYQQDKSKDIILISLGENDYAYFIAEKMREFGFRVHPLWGIDLRKGLEQASKVSKHDFREI